MELQTIIEQASAHCDLTQVEDEKRLYTLTQTLLDQATLSVEEVRNAAARTTAPLEFRVAAKLFESRRFALRNKQAVSVGVVFAMWGEQNRLRPKSDSNPNGEDALRRKIAQLEWISADSPISWHLYAVDDGCPHGSGRLAQEIVHDLSQGERVKVLFLKDHVGKGAGIIGSIRSVDESRKGGSIILGCQHAIRDGVDAIIYTDADSSVHLGQIGLLLQKFIYEGNRIVLGNRKLPDAVLVKAEDRWGVGIKVLRHMQRMVGQAIYSLGILDTQAAFKLFERETLKRILASINVVDFSFDTDWIACAIARGERIETIPFAFIDSFAESASITQGPMTTWESLLKGLVKSVRAHGLTHNRAMAQVIEQEIKDARDLECLIDHLPAELVDTDPERLGDPKIMSPEALQAWIRERKRRDRLSNRHT